MRNLQINTNLRHDYDTGYNFNENFKILRYSDNRNTSLSLYIDYGNLSADFSLSDYFKIIDNKYNKVKLIKYLVNGDYCYYSELKNIDTNRLIFELIEHLGYYNSDYEAINEISEILSDINITYKSDYTLISVTGYSQGDYAEILVNTTEFKKNLGTDFIESEYQEYFSNLFYNAEILGEIEINFDYTKNCVNYNFNETFDFCEISNDNYKIDLNIDWIINYIQNRINDTVDLLPVVGLLQSLNYNDIDTNTSHCS